MIQLPNPKKPTLLSLTHPLNRLNAPSHLYLHDVYDSQWQVFSAAAAALQDDSPTASADLLLNRCDKELDEEILTVYRRANQAFTRLLRLYDKLAEQLSERAVNLTNQVCATHAGVRKGYLQRLKNKRIRRFDVKQKWLRLVENMTHEKCLWHEVCVCFIIIQ